MPLAGTARAALQYFAPVAITAVVAAPVDAGLYLVGLLFVPAVVLAVVMFFAWL